MDSSIFTNTVIILALCVLTIIVCHYLNLPTILGYLAVGLIFGPHGIGIIEYSTNIIRIAEMGVVFLMFMVGLEFSLNKLFQLKFNVFVLGGLQVILTSIFTAGIAATFNMQPSQAIIIGGIVAMSSTAIVMKYLTDKFEINSPQGQSTAGILLFQDLSVIPFFIIIISMIQSKGESTSTEIFYGLFKGVLTVSLMLLIGRWLISPLCNIIIKTKIRELFTLFALLLTLASAWLTSSIGLTSSLGAFIGGVLLSETHFRHQIEIEIRPFRDILMGIFFISIGLLLNVTIWPRAWPWILLLFAAIVIGKATLIFFLARVLGKNSSTAFRTALNLAQGGEFGFAILTLSMQHNLIPSDYAQVILSALMLSFAVAPLILQWGKKLTEFVYPNQIDPALTETNKATIQLGKSLKNHVVLCGFGRIGQNIARLLHQEKVHYIAADINPEIIRKSQIAGEPVIYGDITHPDLLQKMQLTTAAAVLISTGNLNNNIKILDFIRGINEKIPIIVSCEDEKEYDLLQTHKPTEVIAEKFEESISIALHLLQQLHIPAAETNQLVKQIRSTQYDTLRKVFRSGFKSSKD